MIASEAPTMNIYVGVVIVAALIILGCIGWIVIDRFQRAKAKKEANRMLKAWQLIRETASLWLLAGHECSLSTEPYVVLGPVPAVYCDVTLTRPLGADEDDMKVRLGYEHGRQQASISDPSASYLQIKIYELPRDFEGFKSDLARCFSVEESTETDDPSPGAAELHDDYTVQP